MQHYNLPLAASSSSDILEAKVKHNHNASEAVTVFPRNSCNAVLLHFGSRLAQEELWLPTGSAGMIIHSNLGTK